jgi:type I restriction enzyme S subunit
MNAERLLAHYERIADAPDAIPRLRRFVLDLAVRGKLVPQDPNDEPAWELVKRIAAEKARLAKAREIKEPKALELPDAAGSALPQNWALVSLGHVINRHLGGGTPSKNNPNYWNGSVLWASVKDVGKSKYLDETIDRITEEGLANSSSNLIPAGSLLVVTRMGLGKVSINRVPVAINQDLRALFLSSLIDVNYCYNFFLTHGFEGKGLTVKGIKIEELLRIPFPLPPLAEQHRIAAKVNQLMALCDRLEAASAVREATRDRLTAASLARLKVLNPETFHTDAHFALHALPTLTARPDQINQLRQTILNLAIRGKLVPHDPNDEPASDLLTRIAAENRKLLVEKGIRPQKPAVPAENFEVEAKIPRSWLHVYLQDIAYQITDGTHLTPKYTEQGKPFLSAQNVKPFKFMPEKHRFVSEIDFDNYRANRRPERGDILMTRVGAGIGEAAVLDSDSQFAFYVSLCLIKIPNRVLSADYLVLWLNSPEGRDSSTRRTYGKGASQGNLNLGLIRTFKIPLPPLAEQYRIVAKVDELMALCDRLETSLATATDTRRRLLDALLAEALSPALTVDREAAE